MLSREEVKELLERLVIEKGEDFSPKEREALLMGAKSMNLLDHLEDQLHDTVNKLKDMEFAIRDMQVKDDFPYLRPANDQDLDYDER